MNTAAPCHISHVKRNTFVFPFYEIRGREDLKIWAFPTDATVCGGIDVIFAVKARDIRVGIMSFYDWVTHDTTSKIKIPA